MQGRDSVGVDVRHESRRSHDERLRHRSYCYLDAARGAMYVAMWILAGRLLKTTHQAESRPAGFDQRGIPMLNAIRAGGVSDQEMVI
jgi:hypothetical protein